MFSRGVALRVFLMFPLGGLALPCAVQAGTVLYVDDTATGANDGSTWCDGYVHLQDALTAATASGGAITEIRVAQGLYQPDRDSANPSGTEDREDTFQLINGVAIKGGYAGCGTADPDERNVEVHPTILSGDLSGDDASVPCTRNSPDCDSFGELCVDGFCIISDNNAENSYHVVTGSDTDDTPLLDGFTFTGGNADGP